MAAHQKQIEDVLKTASVFRIIAESFGLVGTSTRRTVWLSAAAFSALRLLDVVSLGLVFPIVGILGDKRDSLDQFTDQRLLEYLQDYSNTQIAILLGLLLVSLIIVKSILSLCATYWFGRSFFLDEARCTGRLFHMYLNAPIGFHNEKNTAELVRNLVTTMPAWYGQVIRPLGGVISDFFLAAAIAVVLVYANPMAAVVGLGVLTVGGSIFWYMAAKPVRELARETHFVVQKYNQSQFEALATIQDIKVLGKYDFFTNRFNDSINRIVRVSYLYQVLQQIPQHVIEITAAISIFAFILLANLNLVVGDVVSFIALFVVSMLRLMPSAQRLVSTLNQMRGAATAFEQIKSDVTQFGGWFLRGGPSADAIRPRPASVVDRSNDAVPAIELKNVGFGYAQIMPALRDITLKIPHGGSIGVVGPSGAGKTTLARILLGLLRPTTGQIFFNGQVRPGEEPAIERSIGYVPQDIALLDDTVRGNIAFGVPENEVDHRAMASAIKSAQLEDVIASLPQGLDTFIGERGVRLSGGQRQRIAIARALYPNPDILVLDEATSALDVETEKRITKTLEDLAEQKTLIIIAHRLSTVQHCDNLFFLRDGDLIARGPFGELYQNCDDFRGWVKQAQLVTDPASRIA